MYLRRTFGLLVLYLHCILLLQTLNLYFFRSRHKPRDIVVVIGLIFQGAMVYTYILMLSLYFEREGGGALDCIAIKEMISSSRCKILERKREKYARYFSRREERKEANTIKFNRKDFQNGSVYQQQQQAISLFRAARLAIQY